MSQSCNNQDKPHDHTTTQDLPIAREKGPSEGRYIIRLDGAEAEMTYSRAGEAFVIIDQASDPDALRGRSVGQALVRRAVEDARPKGRFILPLCPFARAQIEHHPDWQDILKR